MEAYISYNQYFNEILFSKGEHVLKIDVNLSKFKLLIVSQELLIKNRQSGSLLLKALANIWLNLLHSVTSLISFFKMIKILEEIL